MITYRVAACLAIVASAVAACSSALPGPTPSRVASATPAPATVGPTREPAHLERLPGEQAVVDAFTAAGINVTLIGGSHSEGQLGRALPARVFIAAPDRNQGAVGAGADVLFLPAEGRWDIRVCETQSSEPGRYLYEIRLNGARVGGSDAARRVHHLVNDRLFVIAYAGPSADALQRGLGLSLAPC